MLPATTPIGVPPGIAVLLRDLIHERSGIFFESDRLDTMLDKLRDRALVRGCQSYLDYYYILKYDEHSQDEWLRVMDSFSVQETYFYREFGQIQALIDAVVPEWFKKSDAPLQIWSAACASGEEPYSIAMALTEAGWGSHPITIVASDGSEAALARARAGLYRERSFRSFPTTLKQKYFESTPEGALLRRNEILPVEFSRANLANARDLAGLSKAPVVFCRNVFIYFSLQAIERTAGYFADGMPDGGYLFIGASESLLKLKTCYELQELKGAFVYRRRPRIASALKP